MLEFLQKFHPQHNLKEIKMDYGKRGITILIAMIIVILVIWLMNGCSRQYTVDQADAIARDIGIRSEVRWYSVRGNPWADGERIYVDLEWVHDRRMNNRLSNLLLHEEYHNRGLACCKTRSCLMYHQYKYDLILGAPDKKLCQKCRGFLTTQLRHTKVLKP